MKADRAEVSWDESKKKWLIRIVVGEEVIRRYCNDAQGTNAETLRASALKTAADEGYEVPAGDVVVKA